MRNFKIAVVIGIFKKYDDYLLLIFSDNIDVVVDNRLLLLQILKPLVVMDMKDRNGTVNTINKLSMLEPKVTHLFRRGML